MLSKAFGSLVLFTALTGTACAQLTQQQQSDAQKFKQTLQQLDRDAAERNSVPNANGSGRPLPSPLPAAPGEQIFPLQFPLVCMSADQATPVQTAPSNGAPVMGYVVTAVAVPKRPPVGPYTMILFNNGRVGYVPTTALHGFVSPAHAGGTCTVVGLRVSGGPVFELQ